MNSNSKGEPLVSINILNWNRKEDLKRTLTKIRNLEYSNMEIIVIDNDSHDGSPLMVQQEFPEVKLIRLPRNVGMEGWNFGLANSKGEYLVVLDDDSHPEKDAIVKIVEHFQSDRTLGIVAGKILKYPTGEPWATWSLPQSDKSVDWHTFVGSGAAFRREVFEKIGGYPPEFFCYEIEIDLSIRALSDGWNIKYVPEIIFHHAVSPKGRESYSGLYYSVRNNLWVFWKYFPMIMRFDLTCGLILKTLKNNRKIKQILVFLKALLHAFLKARYVSEQRNVVNAEVINRVSNYWKGYSIAAFIKAIPSKISRRSSHKLI